MQKYAIPTLILALVSVSVYAFNLDTDPRILIEKENREKILKCLEDVYAQTGSTNMIRKIKFCESLPLLEITGDNAKATTGSVIPVASQGYTAKHQLVLSGSHDYRIYSDRKGAVWKNNNPSGITYPVSYTLEGLWKERGIRFEIGTLRPKKEGGNYYRFTTIEEGIRGKVVSIRERWENATVAHFLSGWGTDYVKLSFSTDKIISELTEEEFAELFIQQLKKESPGLVNQLVKDGILIIN